MDLFAGSGALGLEALSRGAAHVDFIERRPRTLTVLKRNVETLGVGGRAGIFGEDAFAFLARAGRHVCYDIALADPPYDSDAIERLIELNRRAPFAHLLCVECPNDTIRDGEPALAWQRRYGDTTLAFFTTMNGGGYQGDK